VATLVLTVALVAYASSAVAYVAAFAPPALAKAGQAFLLAALAFVAHGAAIGLGCAETHGRHLVTVPGAAGLVAWLAAGAVLVAHRAVRNGAVGAIALPLVFGASLSGAVAPAAASDAASSEGGRP
jgi:ABC-type uncharacterized transport system permease subunit